MVTQRIETIEVKITNVDTRRFSLPDSIIELFNKYINRIDFFDFNCNSKSISGNDYTQNPVNVSSYLNIKDKKGNIIFNRLNLYALHNYYNQNSRYTFHVCPDYSKSFIEVAPSVVLTLNEVFVLSFYFNEHIPLINVKNRLKMHTVSLNTNNIREGKLYFDNDGFLNKKKIRNIYLVDQRESPENISRSLIYYPITLVKKINNKDIAIVNKMPIYAFLDTYQNDKNVITFDDIIFNWDLSYINITDNTFVPNTTYTFNIYYTE